MVWGMALPNNYGEFWPGGGGGFEYDRKTQDDGWFDRLRAYYKEQTPEEQKRLFDFKGDPGHAAHFYGTFPAYKFNSEPGSVDRNGFEPPYGPIEPHEIPRSYDSTRTYKTLGALIKLSCKILAVDVQLKSILEKLEPGMHGFYPLEIGMPKGQIYPEQYYILRISQYFDAFSREDSWERSAKNYERLEGEELITHRLHLNDSKKGITGLAFRKIVFGNAHLWRERIFDENLICLSDALVAEIERAGLRIPKHYKMKEV
jgi:hypothetical protein